MRGVSGNLALAKVKTIFVKPLKERSGIIVRQWADHCEFIFAQRLRRGQQLIAHYRRIWQEKELIHLLNRIKRQWILSSRGLLLAAVPFAFDWEKERIPNELILEQLRAIDYVHKLHDDTLLCSDCHLRRIIDRRVAGIKYCDCSQGRRNSTKVMDQWEPYLERDNIIIWRRPEGAGQFAYKVYGRYEDVTAEDFFFVQTDVEYRKEWDKSAIALDIVDAEAGSNSNVVYWELLWPKLFANRDFVFKRRTFVDKKGHLMVIVNQSTEHPSCPVVPKNQRVTDYWSYMVIKPKTTFRKAGLEFVVTYFDNPGIVMPPTVTKWVSRIYMPDFLNKLHQATLRYAREKDSTVNQDERFSDEAEEEESETPWPDPGFEYPPEREFFCNTKEDSRRGDRGGGRIAPRESSMEEKLQEEAEDIEENEEKTAEETRKRSWWSYLHPYTYFA